jgi:hypothetical protein
MISTCFFCLTGFSAFALIEMVNSLLRFVLNSFAVSQKGALISFILWLFLAL